MREHIVLDPADFGTTGLTLGHLIGIALSDPGPVLPRVKVYGRGGGWESVASWRSRAVDQVLKDNGVDINQAATGPMVKTVEGVSS